MTVGVIDMRVPILLFILNKTHQCLAKMRLSLSVRGSWVHVAKFVLHYEFFTQCFNLAGAQRRSE